MALDVLYEADVRGTLPTDTLETRRREGYVRRSDDADPELEPSPDVDGYLTALIEGVESHKEEIDALITKYSDRWLLERMPLVDRNLLRIAILELKWMSDVPTAVAINESIELAKLLSTESSSRFLNGLLGRVAETE